MWSAIILIPILIGVCAFIYVLFNRLDKYDKEKFINDNNHLILKSGHPSPLSANKGYWFGNKHFLKCNDFLIKQNMRPIKWL